MKNKLSAVSAFHLAFGLGVNNTPTTEIDEATMNLRFSLMDEENKEYLDAMKNKDLIEVADALGDMLYILCGTIITHGMQDVIDKVFEEIQRSNMSKLGSDGKPIYREDGKAVSYTHLTLPTTVIV